MLTVEKIKNCLEISLMIAESNYNELRNKLGEESTDLTLFLQWKGAYEALKGFKEGIDELE